jgi:hypothetical protein
LISHVLDVLQGPSLINNFVHNERDLSIPSGRAGKALIIAEVLIGGLLVKMAVCGNLMMYGIFVGPY